MSQRTDRVDELLRQEIGAILAREVADPRIGFATVTDVETTRDLSHAKVWVSVIGDTAERRETLEALERAMGFVRRELGVRLHLRRIPRSTSCSMRRWSTAPGCSRSSTSWSGATRRGRPRSPTRPSASPCRRRSLAFRARATLPSRSPMSSRGGRHRARTPACRRNRRAAGRPACAASAKRRPGPRPSHVGQAPLARRSTPPDALMSIDLRPLATAVPDAVVERMRVARCVLAIGHESPDADALGAAIAIALLVEARGGRATVAASDAVPDLYRFLEGSDAVRTDPEPGVPYDLVVLCDCGDLSRAGAIRERNAALFAATPLLTIDHHASNDASGDLVWIDPGAAATCEMVALLATRLGVPLALGQGRLAAALAAGIVMDTATFAHPMRRPGRSRSRPRSWRRGRRSPRSAAASTARSRTRSSPSSGGCSRGSSPTRTAW